VEFHTGGAQWLKEAEAAEAAAVPDILIRTAGLLRARSAGDKKTVKNEGEAGNSRPIHL
jgi:hypothetical protein